MEVIREGLTYDDISIVPKYSTIEHRGDCCLGSMLTKKKVIGIPIVSAPMDTVTEIEMMKAIEIVGGVGTLHRFMSIEKQAKMVSDFICWKIEKKDYGSDNTCAAIGVTGDFIERAQELVRSGCNVLLIDIAHGHHRLMKEAIEKIRKEVSGDYEIVGGNIATRYAARDLCEWGVDAIRCGVGSGSLCETRIRTGIGIPQVDAVRSCVEVAQEYEVPVWADGGIRIIGDVAKALALGADVVMIGSLLSGTKETPGDVQKVGMWPNEQLSKRYRGSASVESKRDRGEISKNIEGNSIVVPYKGKIKRIVSDIIDGVRSSMSYVGAVDLAEFRAKAEFVKVTQAGMVEGKPHLMEG